MKRCEKHGENPPDGWKKFESKKNVVCGTCGVERKHEWYVDNTKYHSDKERKRLADLKYEVMFHYSSGEPKCSLCSIDDIDYLCLDHINNDGATHRRNQNVSKGRVYAWCKRNKYPNMFRVLCHNCNIREFRRNSGGCGKSLSAIKSRKTKYTVMSHYSNGEPLCSKCSETEMEVLTIDHIYMVEGLKCPGN